MIICVWTPHYQICCSTTTSSCPFCVRHGDLRNGKVYNNRQFRPNSMVSFRWCHLNICIWQTIDDIPYGAPRQKWRGVVDSQETGKYSGWEHMKG